MKRRDTLKTIVAGTLGTALVVKSCAPDVADQPSPERTESELYGRTPEEQERDDKMKAEGFFNEHEMATLAVLCDLIIPADEISGSATEAKVPEFIDFMMLDYPRFQLRMRGGLMWLDHTCNQAYSKVFMDGAESEQKAILDRIVDIDTAAPEDLAGARFFNLARDLTATGFFTSEIGVKDIGYKGNVPNFWDGVPQDVLDDHGLAYNEKWLDKYVKQDKINVIPEWDVEGNIVN